jgi:hypothetical protein
MDCTEPVAISMEVMTSWNPCDGTPGLAYGGPDPIESAFTLREDAGAMVRIEVSGCPDTITAAYAGLDCPCCFFCDEEGVCTQPDPCWGLAGDLSVTAEATLGGEVVTKTVTATVEDVAFGIAEAALPREIDQGGTLDFWVPREIGCVEPIEVTVDGLPGATVTSGEHVVWEAAEAGSYDVTLAAADDDGNTDEARFTLDVLAPEPDGCGCRAAGRPSAAAVLLTLVLCGRRIRRDPRATDAR